MGSIIIEIKKPLTVLIDQKLNTETVNDHTLFDNAIQILLNIYSNFLSNTNINF